MGTTLDGTSIVGSKSILTTTGGDQISKADDVTIDETGTVFDKFNSI